MLGSTGKEHARSIAVRAKHATLASRQPTQQAGSGPTLQSLLHTPSMQYSPLDLAQAQRELPLVDALWPAPAGATTSTAGWGAAWPAGAATLAGFKGGLEGAASQALLLPLLSQCHIPAVKGRWAWQVAGRRSAASGALMPAAAGGMHMQWALSLGQVPFFRPR